MAEYRAAVHGEPARPLAKQSTEGSLEELVRDYCRSPAWSSLSDGTKRQRENIFQRVLKESADLQISEIDRSMIAASRDKMSGPGAAKHLVQSLRGLFKWAVDVGRLDADPTEGVKVSRPKSEGFHVWTDAEVAQFEARWPVGTRERLILAVLLYTGLRRGDAAALGWKHIKDGVIGIAAGKTGAAIVLPILPELQEIIDASPTGSETIIATVDGRPMTKESLGNFFRDACIAAGVPGRAHGLRKAGATRAAEAGATPHQLNAIFGWEGIKMGELYTRAADRRKMAKEAVELLRRR